MKGTSLFKLKQEGCPYCGCEKVILIRSVSDNADEVECLMCSNRIHVTLNQLAKDKFMIYTHEEDEEFIKVKRIRVHSK